MANARTAKSTREKAAQLRAEQERQAARRRNITVAIALVAILVIAIGGYAFVRTLMNQQEAKRAAASKPPANLYTTKEGATGILYGKDSAKVTVTMYEDFICPACKAFEEADKTLLRSYADQGKVKLVYVPVAILDGSSSTKYSTRAGSAAMTVVNAAPDKFVAFHDLLYTNQPDEGSAGLPDAQLVDLAVQAGVAKDKVQAGITGQSYSGYMTKVTDAFTAKYNSTPTVLLNGTQLKNLDQTTLKAALDKAVG